MKHVPGSTGTSASIALRLGQAIFSASSIFFMSLGIGFYGYTAFCFLVTIMGLVIPWSFTLALLDGYSILTKFPIHQTGILQVILLGDSVIPILRSTYRVMLINGVIRLMLIGLIGSYISSSELNCKYC